MGFEADGGGVGFRFGQGVGAAGASGMGHNTRPPRARFQGSRQGVAGRVLKKRAAVTWEASQERAPRVSSVHQDTGNGVGGASSPIQDHSRDLHTVLCDT